MCPICNNVRAKYDYWTKEDIKNNDSIKESYNNLMELIEIKSQKNTKHKEEILEDLIWCKYINIFDDEITLALTRKNKHHIFTIILPFRINKVLEIPLP